MENSNNYIEKLKNVKEAPLTLKKMKQTKNTLPNYSTFKKLFKVKKYNSSSVRLVQFYKPISKL